MLATPTMATSAAAGLRGTRPSPSHHDSFSEYDVPPGLSGPRSVHKRAPPHTQKYPHTRAQLANIAREHRIREQAASSPSHSTTSPDSGSRALPSLSSPSATTAYSNGVSSLIAEGHHERENDHDHDHDQEEEVRVSSELVRQVAGLLNEENEEGLKELLRKSFEVDDAAVETSVLDLMHSHKDDISGVPFLFLTPTRRPISRPSSRASNASFRLAPGPQRAESPISAPSSPSLLGPIRRPHTPTMSPLATSHYNVTSYITASPTSSPTFAHVQAASYIATSLPASPLSSPRLLNAKASEFRPQPRPMSAASSIPTPGSFIGRRTETPSPDLWAHGPGSLRGASKLAIASPLIPDNTLLPPGTPPRAHTPTSPLRLASHSGQPEDDEDDPFDPFAQAAKMHTPQAFHSGQLSGSSGELGAVPHLSEWNGAYPHPSTSYPDMFGDFDSMGEPVYGPHPQFPDPNLYGIPVSAGNGTTPIDMEGDYDIEASEVLTDGMTPFDVLSSVFGASLAPSELEEALAVNGYDFERAMQWLIERARPAGSPPDRRSPGYGTYAGGGVHVVRTQGGVLTRGGRSGLGPMAPNTRGRFGNGNGRGPNPGGNRVCRYFLQGECMRADCKFSHDLDRALCRFWLRGACAKGENCEFLHHLPNEVDVSGLNQAMSQTEISDSNSSQTSGGSVADEFPTLSYETARGGRRGFGPYADRGRSFDPSRSRFANAVKKGAPSFPGSPGAGGLAAQMANRREAKAALGDSVFSRPTVVAPRPSARIRLRAPLLLPTLATGESVNALYMSYRQRALQLGAARNACLSRAADAWRRGDGAAAKRFSREGHDLNAKMTAESAEAASKLVRARANAAEAAVRTRDAAWSSDPADRSTRGRPCGNGLGVCLGVVGKESGDEFSKLTQEERTEAALDLHGLHSNEAAEVLEEFLLALEKEHFLGLVFLITGEEKHTGTQDAARGASRARLATGVREWLHNWNYPWLERDGIICVDPLTHSQ